MKVVVYAICKNELAFVDRWVNSMSEADEICVLDTGSTDESAARLKLRGVQVHTQAVKPWRFDAARNLSLSFVPEDTDICVCTDLDEVFASGWRKKLENAWLPGTVQARYRYTWSFTPSGAEGVVFYQEKVHCRHGFTWVHPVHETLKWTLDAPAPTVTALGVQLNHYPDAAKSRSQYLPLLELAVRETPNDDRSIHYLGREYFFHRRWDDCLRTLARHLSLPSATWCDERAASMRYMAKCYLQKGEPEKAKKWYLYAIAEAPHLREAYIDLAQLLYEEENWEGVLYFTDCALAIKERPLSYICEENSLGALPHDLRAIAYYRTNRVQKALHETDLALRFSPNDARFLENRQLLQKKSGHPL